MMLGSASSIISRLRISLVFSVLVLGCISFGKAVAADEPTTNFVLLANTQLELMSVSESEATQLFTFTVTELKGKPIKVSLRSERNVGDPFLTRYTKQSWFGYLERLNRLYFQQRLRYLPEILSLEEFLAKSVFSRDWITFASESDLKGLELPPNVVIVPIR